MFYVLVGHLWSMIAAPLNYVAGCQQQTETVAVATFCSCGIKVRLGSVDGGRNIG